MARGGKLSMGGKVGIVVQGVGKGTPTRVSIRVTPRTARTQALRPKTAGRPMVVKVAGVKRTPRQVRTVRVAAKRSIRAIARRARSVKKSARQRIIAARRVARIKVRRLNKRMARLKARVKPKLALLKARLKMAKAKARIRSRIAALKAKIKKTRVARAVLDKAIVKKIVAGRGGYTPSSKMRKGKLD